MENIYGFINLWNCHLLGKKFEMRMKNVENYL